MPKPKAVGDLLQHIALVKLGPFGPNARSAHTPFTGQAAERILTYISK